MPKPIEPSSFASFGDLLATGPVEAPHPEIRRGQVSLVFSTHRPETVEWSRQLMARHDAIVLEEPPSPGFQSMLEGNTPIDEYLLEGDYEYPDFMRESCRRQRELHTAGKILLQIDPFMEVLGRIHDHFADGGTGADFPDGSPEAVVLASEREATGRLLTYYETSVKAPFEAVVAAVKRFARADAARIALRDILRADAIASAVAAAAMSTQSIYVEAGYIHHSLLPALLRRLKSQRPVKPVYLLEPVTRRLTGGRQFLGPGDRLTLLYIFRPHFAGPEADLLAARSLIYIKLLTKEEITASPETFPHVRDEATTRRLTDILDWNDCRTLFPALRLAKTERAREIVKEYLGSR